MLRQLTAIQKVLNQRCRSLLEVEALLIQLEEELQTREGIASHHCLDSSHMAKTSYMLVSDRGDPFGWRQMDHNKDCHHHTML